MHSIDFAPSSLCPHFTKLFPIPHCGASTRPCRRSAPYGADPRTAVVFRAPSGGRTIRQHGIGASCDLQHGAADGVGGSTRLPQIGISRTNVGLAMLLEPKMHTAGDVTTSAILASLGHRASMTVACS